MATQLTSAGIQDHEVVSPNELIASRKELLRKKEFTKLRDELRLLEVPVPIIYGRSADEHPFPA